VQARTEAENDASRPVPAARTNRQAAKAGPEAMKAKIAYRVRHT
jgi:hypothetical protein